MSEFAKSWILKLFCASFLCSIAASFVPKGKLRCGITLCCGALSLYLFISPFMDIHTPSLSEYFSKYRAALDFPGDLQSENDRLIKAIIEEKSEAYILDKAKLSGIHGLKVSVSSRQEGEKYPYPWEVSIEGDFSESQKLELEQYIENELGIARQRQYWRSNENTGY